MLPMRNLIAVPLLLPLLLVGCGEDGESHDSPKSTVEVTTEATTATPEQYGSIVADHDAGEALLGAQEACGYFLTQGSEDLGPICSAMVLTLSYVATALEGDLAAASDDIGAPPAELEDLVAETQFWALRMSAVADKWQRKGCESSSSKACEDLNQRLLDLRFDSPMDRWAPYT